MHQAEMGDKRGISRYDMIKSPQEVGKHMEQ